MLKTSVSVIIPTFQDDKYSDTQYLPEAIASIRSQTYQPIEVIVVDGGSPEPVIPPFDIDQWIRINTNVGVCESIKRGVEAANSEWVITLNADDKLRPTFVEQALLSVEGTSGLVEMVLCASEYLSNAILTRNLCRYCAMARKSFFLAGWGNQEMGFGNGKQGLMTDWDMWLRLWLHYGSKAPVSYIDPGLLDYRHRKDSVWQFSDAETDKMRDEMLQIRGVK